MKLSFFLKHKDGALMKAIKRLIQLSCLALLFIGMVSYSNANTPSLLNEDDSNTTNLTLYFNKETGAQFAARTHSAPENPSPRLQITFYTLKWDNKSHQDVHIEHGIHSFNIHNVIGVSTSVVDGEEMVDEYKFDAGYNNGEAMSHNQARLTMLAILKDLKQKGWQRYIELSAPRLDGKDAIKFANSKHYSLDADYPYSLDEWMQLKNGAYWQLQANGIFLTIQMYRQRNETEPNAGKYYVSYKLQSEKKFYAPYYWDFDKSVEQNTKHWVSLYPEGKKQMNQARAKQEAELKTKGININESYQDPPLVSKK